MTDRESNVNARWIKEATFIRKSNPILNRDDGRPACQARASGS